MKQLLILLLILFSYCCKTENIYLTILSQREISQVTDTVRVARYRFSKELLRADSLFDSASDAAMKSAQQKTKHFN